MLGPAPSAPSRRAGWQAFGLGGGLALLLALAWVLTTIEVQVEIDGRSQTLRTRAGSVGALLVEHRIDVAAGDLVIPGAHARLHDGDHVVVQRARPVRIHVDGRLIRMHSHGRSAQALLQEAGVRVAPRDGVKVNDRIWPLDQALVAALPAPGPERQGRHRLSLVRAAEAAGLAQAEPSIPEADLSEPIDGPPGDRSPWEIEVLRAVPVTLVEDGVAVELMAAGETVSEGLASAGFSILPEDELIPPPESLLDGGMRISLRRALPFTVYTADVSQTLRARADTIGEALTKTGLALVGKDYSLPAADSPLVSHMDVEVIRVLEDVLVQELPIGYATETQSDPNLMLDETRVLRAGESGLKTQRIAITYENGVEIDRQLVEEVVLREPVSEILAYGTQVVWRTVNTEEGPKQYWRHLRVYATSYSASRSGTPKSAPWYGRTRLGWPMRRGLVAVDPRLIPLRTNLFVPGFGVGVAADTGGGIKRYHIDLGFDDDNYESWHQWVDLYLLEPLPPERDMTWILP